MSETTASRMVDAMAGVGIRHIYAITGDSLNALTDAITRDPRIKFIHMRHEESGAFAASAEAQLTGSLACCAGSSGPGHVHLVNGLYDAARANAPVLAIASTCPSAVYGTGYFQETNPTRLFDDCSLYNQTAVTAEQLPRMLQSAMQAAVSEGGVAVLGLPADLAAQAPADVPGATIPLPTRRLPRATPDEIAAAAAIINAADTVAIFAGSGCAAAPDSLAALARRLNAPVVTSFKSQMELAGHLPGNYLGHMGYLGNWAAAQAIADADAILIVGTAYPFPGFFPKGKKIIQVDIRPAHIGRVAPVDLAVRADAGEFLTRLCSAVSPKSDTSFLDGAMKNYAGIQARLREPVNARGTKGAIRPEFMVATLDRLAPDNCVFTVDTGMNCLWAANYLTPGRDRRMIGSFMHGSMANAMPQSIGAHMACPDRVVIALCGDGGLTMLLGDLLTIIQYNLPVKLLVADNRSLAYVQWEMELAGLKPSQTSLTNPDLGSMAGTIGFTAETVTDPDSLEDAMKRWLAAPGPALLSVVTDPQAAPFTFSKEMMAHAAPGLPTDNFLPPGSV